MKVEFEVLLDNIRHVKEVAANIQEVVGELEKRKILHDLTKFDDPEFSVFCSTRPEFKKVNFGTPEYAAVAEKAKEGVEHHYANNRHHVGFHKNGIEDFNLMDLVEMLADWRAASRRSPDLSFEDSLPRAFEKYGFPEILQKVFLNTIRDLGW